MEMRDVVDEQDNVVGQITDQKAREEEHRIRGVYIVINHSDGRILLQKRSEKKHEPGKWDMTGGGVHSGESYEDAAKREVAEELFHKTTMSELDFKELFMWKHGGHLQFNMMVYQTQYDGEFSLDPDEVADVRWTTWKELVREVEEDNSQFDEVLHLFMHEFLKRYG